MPFRVFEVWLNKRVPGCPETVEEVVIDEDVPDDEVERILQENVNVLIGNETESGWREINSVGGERCSGSEPE